MAQKFDKELKMDTFTEGMRQPTCGRIANHSQNDSIDLFIKIDGFGSILFWGGAILEILAMFHICLNILFHISTNIV